MDFTEGLIRAAAIDAQGTAVLTHQGRELDLSKPFQRLTITEAILKYCGQSGKSYQAAQLEDAAFIRAELKKAVRIPMHQLSRMLGLAPYNSPSLNWLPRNISGSQPTSLITQLR